MNPTEVMNYQTMKTDENDAHYSHELKKGTQEEILDVFVLDKKWFDGDEKSYPCNMCGTQVTTSICLHFLKEDLDEDKTFETIEEEIILCPDCVKKLAQMFEST